MTLTPEQMRWLEQAVAEGRFPSVEDAVRLAVADLMAVSDREDLSWATPYLDQAEAEIERGESIPGDEFLKWLDDHIDELKSR